MHSSNALPGLSSNNSTKFTRPRSVMTFLEGWAVPEVPPLPTPRYPPAEKTLYCTPRDTKAVADSFKRLALTNSKQKHHRTNSHHSERLPTLSNKGAERSCVSLQSSRLNRERASSTPRPLRPSTTAGCWVDIHTDCSVACVGKVIKPGRVCQAFRTRDLISICNLHSK
jgi:hypothetical protein